MPLYDYKCEQCGLIFEDLVTANQSQDYTPQCPRCGSLQTQRLLSAPAIGNSSSKSGRGCGQSGFS